MISVIILTNNSEQVIEDCLLTLEKFADEIILVDSKSTDKTVEIAKKYNAKIVENSLVSFADQRNIGIDHAKGEWIFYIDSDERLTPDFKKEAIEKINSYDPESNTAGYYIKRKTFYFGKDYHLTDKVQRLFYKKKFKEWYGKVHETPKVDGEFGIIKSPILHYTHRNLEQMVEKTNKWSDFEAELRLKANHPKMTWWRFPRVIVTEFVKSYFGQKGWRNGTDGLIESMYQSYSMFITYAKLWELQNSSKRHSE
jgi:glycosyltransferase involved in cell wall biosynthesis